MLRFLGLVNFYRDYIPNFAQFAEPLYRLTRKNSHWVWDALESKAFTALKCFLVDRPLLLVYPNWEEPFYLQTDASRIAVGGVLSQRNSEGDLKPIAYFSSGLSLAQRRYSAGDIECWALIATARKFSNYFKGACKIYFATDHNPLVWLRT